MWDAAPHVHRIQPLPGTILGRTGVDQSALIEPVQIRNRRVVPGNSFGFRRGSAFRDVNPPDIQLFRSGISPDKVNEATIR